MEGCNNFIRRIKLAYNSEFSTLSSVQKENKFKVPSDYTPPKGSYPPEIDLLQNQLKVAIRNLPDRKRTPDNLLKAERSALRELKSNKSLVIKKADKGAAVVLLDRQDYCKEAQRQLLNKIHYKSIEAPIFPKYCKKYNSILQEMFLEGLITKKEWNYLVADPKAKERTFYLLPKIHKDKSKWIDNIPPGRPIVSDINSESYRIACFIDFHLTPFSTSHPSYVKNTFHFLERLRETCIGPKDLLISLDVDSLYTNIDSEFGLSAIQDAFKTNPNRIHKHILQLLKLCLEGNDFSFDGQYFLQIHGTAMGRVFAPKYADIVMAAFERTALAKCDKKPSLYLRYLDDIFIIWPHPRQEFDTFFNIFNSQHERIKFKANIQESALEFLDVLVYKGENFKNRAVLDTKVYFKDTDSHALLQKKSFHPKHVFSGIIKSQLIRFARICQHKYDFDEACDTLFNALYERFYSRKFLRNLKNEAARVWYPPLNAGTTPCHTVGCPSCQLTLADNTIHSDKGRCPLTIKGTCKTTKCIFLAKCSNCPNSTYIGSSWGNIGDMIMQIQNGQTSPDGNLFYLHFTNPGHTGSIRFTILERMSTPSEAPRLRAKWMKRLDSVQKGLNIKTQIGNKDERIPLIIQFHPLSTFSDKIISTWVDTYNNQIGSPFKSRPLSVFKVYAKDKNLAQL